MDSSHSHRRPRKIRRTGRHTQPSQAEKVAEVATKAAPAVAIAGALVATAPQAQASVGLSAQTTTVAEHAHTDAVVEAVNLDGRTVMRAIATNFLRVRPDSDS